MHVILPKPYPSKPQVNFVIQLTPQPWHPQSASATEVALAVSLAAASKSPPLFFHALKFLYENQDDLLVDKVTNNLSRTQIHEKLVEAIFSSTAITTSTSNNKEELQTKVYELLDLSQGGNGVVQTMKWQVKYHRCRSIHVTPTVLMNGLEAGDIGSGFSIDEWKGKLEGVGAVVGGGGVGGAGSWGGGSKGCAPE